MVYLMNPRESDLKPGKPPERQGPPGSTDTSEGGRTAPSHARNSSTSGGCNPRPKPGANTAHKRQISDAIPRNERPIARQARPEPAKGGAREDRQGRCCRRHCCETQWPCAQAVEGRNW